MGAVPALVPIPAVMNPVNPPPLRFFFFGTSAPGVSASWTIAALFSV